MRWAAIPSAVAATFKKIRPRPVVATVLQIAGIAAVAFGVGIVALWAGVIVGGAGMLLFGLAVEQGGRPALPQRPTIPPPA